ncbi:hypothetical protein ACNKHK_26805 [Shigella flexneri]
MLTRNRHLSMTFRRCCAAVRVLLLSFRSTSATARNGSGHLRQRARGATKEKESLPQMLRGLSKLRNLGQGDVNFGEPMPLMTYLNQHVPEWRDL